MSQKRTEEISIFQKTVPIPLKVFPFLFCMIGFKLMLLRFRQGELFELGMMQGICHLVTDLDDVLQGCELIFQGKGRTGVKMTGMEGEIQRQEETKTLCIILHLMCEHQL